MAAWITVFDNIAKERELLEMPEQDVYGTMENGQVPGVRHAPPSFRVIIIIWYWVR